MLLLLLVEEVQIFSRHFQYCFLSDETILCRARKILFANTFANDSADVSLLRRQTNRGVDFYCRLLPAKSRSRFLF